MQKTFFIFLMAVAIVLPIASAFNCTALEGDDKKVCNYIEDQPWPQDEKDSVIQDAIDNGGTLDGNFKSIIGESAPEIPLNKIEDVDLISEENKIFLIDMSQISIFGYVVFEFLKRYYLLWRFL